MTDSQEPVRKNINKVSEALKRIYIRLLTTDGEFVQKTFLPVGNACHFERYGFVCAQGKLGVVYDTKAEILTFTAKASVLDAAFGVFDAHFADFDSTSAVSETVGRSDEVQSVKDDGQRARNLPNTRQNRQVVKERKKAIGDRAQGKRTPEKDRSSSVQTGNGKKQGETLPCNTDAAQVGHGGERRKSGNYIAAETINAESAADATSVNVGGAAAKAREQRDGFSVKKCTPQRLEGFVARIRALKGVTVTVDGTSDKEIITYAVTDKARKEKCILRYIGKKQSAQLQGKRSNLFGEVQVILSSDSPFGEAVESHAKLTGEQKKASSVQRSLKKLLPDAFDLLSEQSKIDLGIGMVDIGNKEVRLSDYSVLLVPPYRGLERFIFDLQQACSISVKMIGQAYEKDDSGRYRLKLGYRKKTGLVYGEVMSALYTEYFEKRNFYAHSDNTESGHSRVISEKEVAKNIFNNLCEVINYNAKKLKETNFKL